MIEDIQRFIIVHDTSSITQAAKQLHLTQPALSLAMQRLERSLNKRLFLHANRQLRISPQGKEFYPVAKKIIELWEKAKSSDIHIPSVALGLFDNAALRLATYVHKQIKQQEFHLTIQIDRSVNLLRDLSLELLDVVVAVQDMQKKLLSHTRIITTFEEELLPVATRQVVQNSRTLPFILYNSGSFTRNYIDRTFTKYDIIPTILAESTSTSFMKELALNGSGIALLPYAVVTGELQEKQLYVKKLPFRFFRTIIVAVRNDAQESIRKIAETIAINLLA